MPQNMQPISFPRRSLQKSFLIYGQRTPIGNFGGKLSGIRPDDLLSILLKDSLTFLEKHSISSQMVDDVIIGCANQAGEDNRNVARMSLLLAGYPHEVPGSTTNRLCGSSLDALIQATARIESGLDHCLVVGGVESMSRAPYVMSKATKAFDRSQHFYDTALGWRFPNPQMETLFPLLSMGETAEEVALKLRISREEQDQYAYHSHRKAIEAQAQHLFKDEMIPVPLPSQKNQPTPLFCSIDEGPRAETSFEKLQKLSPLFPRPQSATVTAGNSSSLNDGASLCLVVSNEFLKHYPQLVPLARITGVGVAGLEPNLMGLGPVYAIKKLLKNFGMTIQDIDLFELNEAFAAQVLGCIKMLDLNPDLINPRGGSLALGHPLGASGTRIVTTMLHQFKQHPKKYRKSLTSMCIGVGQGIAMSFENCL
jgi:acetyl-CoA acetyltransferase family protein